MELFIEILVKDVGTLDINTKDMESFGIPLTFNVSDIKDFASRKASFSKTIKVLGSPNNNIIFNHLYEIKGDNFIFDMTQRHDCVLTVNKATVMEGYLVLKEIQKIKVGDRFQVVYDVVIFDQAKNFFEEISGNKLTDLDFSSGFTFNGVNYNAGDHTFDETTIGYAMNYHLVNSVYTYPIIDYGYYIEEDTKPFPYENTVSANILYPAVFLRAVIDRIFYESSGYTYESQFFNGDTQSGMINQMVLPSHKGIEYDDLHMCEYVANSFSTGSGAYKPDLDRNNAIMNSLQTVYYEIDDYLTSAYSGGTFMGKGPAAQTENDHILRFRVEATNDRGGLSDCPLETGVDTRYYVMKWNIKEQIRETVGTFTSTMARTYAGTPLATSYYYEVDISLTDVNDGDVYFIIISVGQERIDLGIPPPGSKCRGQAITLQVAGLSLELICVRDKQATTDVKINNILPDMDQSTFIRNLIKMFNLYIYADKEDPNKLFIEPRDEFYKQGGLVNWTEKVDYNKDIKIKTLSSSIANNIGFHHKLGTDYYSTQYKNTYNETYGDKIIDLQNPQLSENKDITIDFQSYMMQNRNIWNVPVLYEEQNYQHTYFDDRSDFEPFVAFIESKGGNIQFGNWTSGVVRNATITSPKVGTHAKIMGGFSFDLNYETETGYTFTFSGYDPTRGLYKIFWENYMNDLIDDSSRIVEMYCNLNLNDITALNFKNRVLIDGQVYYLEKVEYDPSKRNSSKVTLMKEIDPIAEGSFETWFLLKNDSGDYVLTDASDKIIIN